MNLKNKKKKQNVIIVNQQTATSLTMPHLLVNSKSTGKKETILFPFISQFVFSYLLPEYTFFNKIKSNLAVYNSPAIEVFSEKEKKSYEERQRLEVQQRRSSIDFSFIGMPDTCWVAKKRINVKERKPFIQYQMVETLHQNLLSEKDPIFFYMLTNMFTMPEVVFKRCGLSIGYSEDIVHYMEDFLQRAKNIRTDRARVKLYCLFKNLPTPPYDSPLTALKVKDYLGSPSHYIILHVIIKAKERSERFI